MDRSLSIKSAYYFPNFEFMSTIKHNSSLLTFRRIMDPSTKDRSPAVLSHTMQWKDNLKVQLQRSVVTMNELTEVAIVELTVVIQMWLRNCKSMRRIKFNGMLDQHVFGNCLFCIVLTNKTYTLLTLNVGHTSCDNINLNKNQHVLQVNIRSVKRILEKYFDKIKDDSEVIIEIQRNNSDSRLVYGIISNFEGNKLFYICTVNCNLIESLPMQIPMSRMAISLKT